MDRLEVIQRLIDKRNFSIYLEIGVSTGWVFFKIKCKKKIAVDPEFRFNWKGRLGETFKNIYNVSAVFFKKTSDEFFSQDAHDVLKTGKLDIVLIDGMHEFHHALNDVLNSLEYLSENGVIIMHDCNPKTPEAAVSFEEWRKRDFTGDWLGDVWKCIPYLKECRPDLDVFVADCDLGLGVITKRSGVPIPEPQSKERFKNLSFNELNCDRQNILNLKPESHLYEFILK